MSEHSRHALAHIDSIVKQEEQAMERRSYSERFADSVGTFAGSLTFVVLHLLLLVAWLLTNSGKISGIRPFDSYPFALLGVIVAVEAVILSSFILMRQNRMMRLGERRDHLNLQVDLLAEKESQPSCRWYARFAGKWGAKTSQRIRTFANSVKTPQLSRLVRA
jgi:uncharacterized membrane protein